MTAQRIGTRLMEWAKRYCTPHQFETVAMPIIADMQFEVLAHWKRSAPLRGWIRVRSYFAFWKALGFTIALHVLRNAMNSRAVAGIRLLLAIPAALLVTLVVQVGLGWSLMYLVYSVDGVQWGRGGEFGGWLVKVLASPFMAAAFFWTMSLLSPRRLRSWVSIGALLLVGLWGALLIYGAVMPWPRFHPWLFAMGLAGWTGGAASYWLARRQHCTPEQLPRSSQSAQKSFGSA